MNHKPPGQTTLRLSNEEAQGGESSSITNQRMIVQNYCKQNGITLVREFVDDGYSGGNFDRPAFQEMMRQLSQGKANTVITTDLSRLGHDMREASYYAEQFFPEHGIHYTAIGDNFDTERENIMAPFLFAMNEVYLRDGSRKVKDVLRSKRESGQHCACRSVTPQERAFTDELLARLAQAEQLGIAQKRLAADAAQYGGPACARNLLRRRQLSEGFFALRAAGRLDLSLEALVTVGKHGALFTDQEVNACLEALLEAGYYGTR